MLGSTVLEGRLDCPSCHPSQHCQRVLQDFGLGVSTRAAGAVVAGRARSRLHHDSGASPSSSGGEPTQVLCKALVLLRTSTFQSLIVASDCCHVSRHRAPPYALPNGG